MAKQNGFIGPTYTNSGSGYLKFSRQMIYSNYAATTVSNTITETGILSGSSAIGVRKIPANTAYPGKQWRIQIRGFLQDTGTPTLRARLYLGISSSVLLWDSGTTTLPAITGTAEFEADFLITCYSKGSSGIVVAQGAFRINNGSTPYVLGGFGNSTALDTTVDNIPELTLTWGTASSSNFATRTTCLIESLN